MGQEIPVRQHQHPGAEAGQQVNHEGLLAGGVRAERRAGQRPGPGLGRRHPPHLRERPVPARGGRPAKERGVLLAVRQVRGRAVDGNHPQPAAEHPRRAVRPDRAGDLLEQHAQRVGAQLAPRPGQRGDVRRPPPAARAGIHPARGIQLPGQQVRAPPPVIQPVRQLDHHLPVAAVPAPEQPQRQNEVHHQPGRQQPPPRLPGPRRVDDRIDQIRRERPCQRADRDPVRQPAIRRQPLSTIMSHKTVTLSRQRLKQGHWGYLGLRPPGGIVTVTP